MLRSLIVKPLNNAWFTSDWHIGHSNVLRLDERPFADLDEMHEYLIKMYNHAVKPEDTCYFLGDMGLCKTDVIQPIIKSLNGTKVLILGNHDGTANKMHTLGFDVVLNSASLIIANRIVTMSHCPLRAVFREDATHMKGYVDGDMWHGEHKNGHYSLPDFGQYHLHGHVHSKPKNKALGRQLDVGLPGNEYRLVSRSQIESWVMKHRNENEK